MLKLLGLVLLYHISFKIQALYLLLSKYYLINLRKLMILHESNLLLMTIDSFKIIDDTRRINCMKDYITENYFCIGLFLSFYACFSRMIMPIAIQISDPIDVIFQKFDCTKKTSMVLSIS